MHTTEKFYAKNGYQIFAQAWRIDAPKGMVITVPGYSEQCGRYAHVAAYLNASGYDMFTLDHQGFGQSEGERGLVGSLDLLAENVVQYVGRVRAQRPSNNPHLPVFMLAHSMGGLTALHASTTNILDVDGLIAIGAATRVGENIPVWQKRLLRLIVKVAPNLTLPPNAGGAISRDPAVIQAFADDPLNWREGVKLGTAAELDRVGTLVEQAAERVTLPIFLLHGMADDIILPGASQYLFDNVGSADKTLRLYEGLYHEILNEPEQNEVLADITNWLDAHVAQIAEAKQTHHQTRQKKRVVLDGHPADNQLIFAKN